MLEFEKGAEGGRGGGDGEGRTASDQKVKSRPHVQNIANTPF